MRIAAHFSAHWPIGSLQMPYLTCQLQASRPFRSTGRWAGVTLREAESQIRPFDDVANEHSGEIAQLEQTFCRKAPQDDKRDTACTGLPDRLDQHEHGERDQGLNAEKRSNKQAGDEIEQQE
jgi:hypothetical protein